MSSEPTRTHVFTLVLERDPSDDEFDALFEAIGDDADLGTEHHLPIAQFDRKAVSMAMPSKRRFVTWNRPA